MRLVRLRWTIATGDRAPLANFTWMRQVGLWCCAAACLLAQTPPVAAEPRDPAWVARMAKDAFFHVSVIGKGRSASGQDIDLKREGKAFAIGPNLLVTALHVVGDGSEWQPVTDAPSEVSRAAQPIQRRVELTRVNDYGPPADYADPIVENFILPAPSYVIDAAGISVPLLDLETNFHLSMCDIAEGQSYFAIMTGDPDPKNPKSIAKPILVELKAEGYDPAKYGGLYVFQAVNDNFAREAEGHDGSPILNSENDVVAIVSAVTAVSGGDYKILATPIQPLFPGASNLLSQAPDIEGMNESLKCSLADTVKRINEQVIAHAIWSLEVEREPDGSPSDEITLRYDSVADKPNIENITVQYDFIGSQKAGKPIRRLQYRDSNSPNELLLERRDANSREFPTSDIVIEGKREVETYLKDENNGGTLDYVELTITETYLVDKRILDKETTLQFKWNQQ